MKASCWVIVDPVLAVTGAVKSFRVDRITQGFPATLKDGEQAFRMEIELPASVFRPIGDVSITVPEQALVTPEVSVGQGA